MNISVLFITLIILIILLYYNYYYGYNNLEKHIILGNHNLIIITIKIINNEISDKRINNITNNLDKYNLSTVILNKPKENIQSIAKKNKISNENILSMLDTFRKSNYEYAIITEDDYEPIDNLLDELNKTVNLLPYNWRTLHLCPGVLTNNNRRFQQDLSWYPKRKKIYKEAIYDNSDRFFIIDDSNIWIKNEIWLGSPTCFLINKDNLDSFIKDYNNQNMYIACDVILTNILTKNDYICKNPLLGWENEMGDSIFDSTINNLYRF